MFQRVSHLALIAALGATAFAGEARAQANEDEVDLGTISLTASGEPVALSRTGATVTVVTEDELRRAGDTSLASQLARLPGVSMTRNGGMGTSTALRIRGLSGPYIGVRIDGIDVSDTSGTQCAYDFGSTTSGNISRIEVLRGSQSALFGSEAIGGVVDITTFRAREEGTEAEISLEGGSNGTWTGTAALGVKAGRAELAFSASRTITDGISAYAYGTEDDAFRASMLTFYGAYELSETVRIGVNGFARDSYTEFDNQNRDNFESESGKLRGGRIFLEAQTGAVSHELSFAHTTTSRYYPLGFTKQFDGDRDQLAYKGSWEGAGNLSLNWGLDHTKETFLTDSDKGETTTNAIFGEALYAVTPDLDISLALRRDDHETFGGRTSGRAALAWRPHEDWVIRAVASTGFRAPSLYELYNGYGGNRNLKPETSRSFELGAEYAFAANGMVQVTLFDTEIEDKINWIGASYVQVPGTTRTRGVELTGSVEVTPDWRLFGNYTYTDAYAEAGGTRSAAIRVPRHDLAVGIEGNITDQLSTLVSVHHVAGVSDALYPFPPSPMPDYTLVNAGLNYAISDQTEAWLRIENLFDEEYQTVRNYGQPGRQVFVGLRTKF